MYTMIFVNRRNAANHFLVSVDTAAQVKAYLKMMAESHHVLTQKNGKTLKSYSR